MFKNKTKIFLLSSILLITIIGISCVSAVDANDTSTNTQHTTDTPTSSNDNIGNNIVKDVQSTSKDDTKIKTQTKEIKKTDKNKETNTKTMDNPGNLPFSLEYADKIEPGSNLTVNYYIGDTRGEELYISLKSDAGTLAQDKHIEFYGQDLSDGVRGSVDFTGLNPMAGATTYYISLQYYGTDNIQTYLGDYSFSFGSSDPNVQVEDVSASTYGGSLLALENNNIKVTLSSDIDVTSPVQVKLTIANSEDPTIDYYEASQTINSFSAATGAEVVFENYYPSTAGEVEVIVEIEFNEKTSGVNRLMTVYYNGYMGKSFTDKSNMTNAAVYEGYNTVKLFNVSDYISSGWIQQTFTFDAAGNKIVDSNKVVDVLYYVPYTYSKGLDFTVIANDELINAKSSYVDQKGFGTYNYPYGLMVYNLTGVFKANEENTIVLTPGTSNNIGLYGTYLVVVYSNTNKRSKIVISEDCDMLSTTSSSYGATSDTAVSYANYENVDVENLTSSKLIVIAGGSDNTVNVLFNDANMGSLDTAYNTANQLSIFTAELDNVVSGSNNVTVQSVNDNLYTFNSILVTSYESKPPVTIEPAESEIEDTVTLTASLVDEIGETNEGKVIFKINGKTLRDDEGKVIYVDVIDGVATLPDIEITNAWMKPETSIQAYYTGTETIDPVVTNPITITITKKEATLVIDGDLEGKAGENVTLSVSVTDKNGNVDSGRVAFKLNGKTLKDADGKALYVNVANGVASITYTIPAKTKTKEYTLTAVFTDTNYERAEANKDFVVS